MDREQRLTELRKATKLTPKDYAELRSLETGMIVRPQNIYYYIRTEKLKLETCDCGRKVLNVEQANEFFTERDKR
jgi:hypothetical protein